MGQYYDILIKQDGVFYHSDRRVDGKYMMGKLMEHSWFNNDTLKCISALIYEKPSRVYWVGDYADDVKSPINGLSKEDISEIHKLTHKEEFAKSKRVKQLGSLNSAEGISLKGKYLVNYDKKIYISGDEYFDLAMDSDGWRTHPLSLLTALGNGLGGGDFRGENEEKVGSWAGDLISVEDMYPLVFEDKTADYIFKENWVS